MTGFSLAAIAVASDQSLLFLFVEESGREAVFQRDQGGIGSFPRARMDSPKRFRLLRENAGSVQSHDLPPLDIAFPEVDMFPDGRLLVVGARCYWRAETDYDLNAVIFDPDTGQANHVLFGDGISDLQIDGGGRIWVAYGDEGIFGNYGWGGPGPAPIGRGGLVCFSSTGEKLWEYPPFANYSIYDCYALNVSGRDAMILAYTEFPGFPVCKISAGCDRPACCGFQLSYWRTDLRGCHAFAVSGATALFSSQYDEQPDVAHLVSLDGEEVVRAKARQVRLLMPDGSPRPPGRLQGRGKHLYHFGEGGIYRAALS